jgi:hypothetical protein
MKKMIEAGTLHFCGGEQARRWWGSSGKALHAPHSPHYSLRVIARAIISQHMGLRCCAQACAGSAPSLLSGAICLGWRTHLHTAYALQAANERMPRTPSPCWNILRHAHALVTLALPYHLHLPYPPQNKRDFSWHAQLLSSSGRTRISRQQPRVPRLLRRYVYERMVDAGGRVKTSGQRGQHGARWTQEGGMAFYSTGASAQSICGVQACVSIMSTINERRA